MGWLLEEQAQTWVMAPMVATVAEAAAFACDRSRYETVATAEAVTWTLLLIGMFFKWVLKTTEVGVQIAGPIHGVMFIGYVLCALKLWQEKSWPNKTIGIGLLCAVIPFATIWFEKRAEARGELGDEPRQTPLAR